MNLKIQSGTATLTGFRLFTDDLTLEVKRTSRGIEVIEKPVRKTWLKYLENLAHHRLYYFPLVGSAINLLSFLIRSSGIFIFLILIAIQFLPKHQRGSSFRTHDYVMLFISIVCILYWIILIVRNLPKLLKIPRYHSVEHMTIDCLQKGKPTTIESLRSGSRLTIDCGSILVMLTILLGQIFRPIVLPRHELLQAFLSLIVALDIMKFVDLLKIEWLLWPFLQIERLVCWMPSDEDLELGVELGRRYLAIRNTQQ